MVGNAAVDIHGIAQTELLSFIHSGNVHRRELDKMGVKPPIPANSVQIAPQNLGPVSPYPDSLLVSKQGMQALHDAESLIITTVVTMHDTPEGVVIDLKLQPVMGSGRISKIPGVDGVGSFYETGLRIPAPGMGEHIVQGAFPWPAAG